ncbi:MAG: DUF2207 domain-containing protein [Haliscomenobacter sp.]|nr:DUF2207 domain-containing protein [Haliscomenobacter sp.]
MARFFFLIGCLLAPAGWLHAEYFTIRHYAIHMDVSASGVFSVEETLDVEFSQERHGIYRTIPTAYRVDGKKVRIRISDVETPRWPMEREWELDRLLIRIGDPDRYVSGRQQYVIRYKVRKAWLFPEEHTEFYWNLVGNDWEVPIDSISFTIRFEKDPGLQEGDFRVFTGYRGDQGSDATIAYTGEGQISGASTRPFYSQEGLTVAVRLPVDYIPRPSETQLFLAKYGLLAIPVALLAFILILWERIGRDDPTITMAEYYPPEGISPSEAGAFLDDKVDNRDLIALIPYWASEGLLEIHEVKEKVLFVFSDSSFEFVKLKGLPAGRPAYEEIIFEGLFRDGDRVRLSDLKDKFYNTMNSARTKLSKTVKEKAYYTSQSLRFKAWFPVFGALSLAAGVGAFLFPRSLPGWGWPLLGCCFHHAAAHAAQDQTGVAGISKIARVPGVCRQSGSPPPGTPVAGRRGVFRKNPPLRHCFRNGQSVVQKI